MAPYTSSDWVLLDFASGNKLLSDLAFAMKHEGNFTHLSVKLDGHVVRVALHGRLESVYGDRDDPAKFDFLPGEEPWRQEPVSSQPAREDDNRSASVFPAADADHSRDMRGHTGRHSSLT
jgi:hypothetical protein